MSKQIVTGSVSPKGKDGIERVAYSVPKEGSIAGLLDEFGKQCAEKADALEQQLGHLPPVDIVVTLTPRPKKE